MVLMNFGNLDYQKFEYFASDVMSRMLGMNMYNYASGGDKGVDLTNRSDTYEVVVQCKRMKHASNFVYTMIHRELPKLKALKPEPKEYYIFTSLPLSIQQRQRLIEAFAEYHVSDAQIISGETLNHFLNDPANQDIKEKYWELVSDSPIEQKTVPDMQVKAENPFSNLISRFPIQTTRRNDFHYSNVLLPEIYGRDAELLKLDDFLNCDGDFRFWVVTGPGGVGKSKLLYSLMKRYERAEEWYMRFVPAGALSEICQMDQFDFDKKLLLVIDYCAYYVEEIKIWFRKLYYTLASCRLPFRLIFIEREGQLNGCNPEWFEKAELNSWKYEKYLYQDQFLMLSGVNPSVYGQIIDQYVQAKNMQDSFSDEKRRLLLKFARERLQGKRKESGEGIRPLYLLLATDEALHMNNVSEFSNWDYQKLHDGIYKRDLQHWEANIPKKIYKPMIRLLTYATMTGGWKTGEGVPEHLKEDQKAVLSEAQGEYQLLANWFVTLTGDCRTERGGYLLPALEPDIIGEYFVLQMLMPMLSEDLQEWLSLFHTEFSSVHRFLYRMFEDYCCSDDQRVDYLLMKLLGKLCEMCKGYHNTELVNNGQIDSEENNISGYAHLYLTRAEEKKDQQCIEKLKEFLQPMVSEYHFTRQCWAELEILHPDVFLDTAQAVPFERLEEYFLLWHRWKESARIAEALAETIGMALEHPEGLTDKQIAVILSWFLDSEVDQQITLVYRYYQSFCVAFVRSVLRLMRYLRENGMVDDSILLENYLCDRMLVNDDNGYLWKKRQFVLVKIAREAFPESERITYLYISYLGALADLAIGSGDGNEAEYLVPLYLYLDQISALSISLEEKLYEVCGNLIVVGYRSGHVAFAETLEKKIHEIYRQRRPEERAGAAESLLPYLQTTDELLLEKIKAGECEESLRRTLDFMLDLVGEDDTEERNIASTRVLWVGFATMLQNIYLLHVYQDDKLSEAYFEKFCIMVQKEYRSDQKSGILWHVAISMRSMVEKLELLQESDFGKKVRDFEREVHEKAYLMRD